MNQINQNIAPEVQPDSIPTPQFAQNSEQPPVVAEVTQTTPENTVAANGGPVNQVQPQDQSGNTIIIDNTSIIEEPTSEVIKNEIKEETSIRIDHNDEEYIKKLKQVIKKDAELPYMEEEESEELNKAYLKTRFNVDVEIDGEN